MRGAEAFFLDKSLGLRREFCRGLAHLVGAMTDHQRLAAGTGGFGRLHHMRDHRQAGNLVQTFGITLFMRVLRRRRG